MNPHHGGGSPAGRDIDWLTIPGRLGSIAFDVRRIRAHPLVPGHIPIFGFVYHVATGRLDEVAAASEAGRPTAPPVRTRHRRRARLGAGPVGALGPRPALPTRGGRGRGRAAHIHQARLERHRDLHGRGAGREVATNLSGEYATRTCCVVALRDSLIRDDRTAAGALTRAVLEAAHCVHEDPAAAAKAFSGYGGKGSIEELTAMLKSQSHGDRPVGGDLRQQIALYSDELKLVKVLKRSTFAERVYADVLS